MRFPFNEKKATQAAAFLLKRHNASLNYMLLIKLLYYADREALLKRGAPITGDQMVSMDYGPVLSGVLDFIKHRKEPGPNWREHIATVPNYVVKLLSEPGMDELSLFEIQTLVKVDEAHGSKDPFDLSNESHSLPEWRDPRGSSLPIEVEEVFKGEKKSEEIPDVAANAKVEWFFRELEEND